MFSAPRVKRKRVLTPEAFGRFLDWLAPDRDHAAEIYLDLRRQLVRLFVARGCAHSEELADETLDRVAFIVSNEPEKYSKPIALCCGVARNVWLEYLREITPDPLEPEDIPAPDDAPARFGDCEEECLTCCLDQLPECERRLITEYHRSWGHEKIESRKRLAAQNGGLRRLRTTAYRIRVKLSACIETCMQKRGVH